MLYHVPKRIDVIFMYKNCIILKVVLFQLVLSSYIRTTSCILKVNTLKRTNGVTKTTYFLTSLIIYSSHPITIFNITIEYMGSTGIKFLPLFHYKYDLSSFDLYSKIVTVSKTPRTMTFQNLKIGMQEEY
jgi:hypothetical protein